ncbi:MAG: hypothetical protein SV760_06735 [Halobacteria archaeon]|nr:hypothetical protein [Halobacteria archaeon]
MSVVTAGTDAEFRTPVCRIAVDETVVNPSPPFGFGRAEGTGDEDKIST